ncbi:MAG: hypothetical protein ACREUC_08960, partial [Steroidobacteraceae bacterium]
GSCVENRQRRRAPLGTILPGAAAPVRWRPANRQRLEEVKMKSSWVPLCAMVLVGCSSSEPPAAPAAAPAGPPFHVALNVKQLMNWIIDPNADVIWNSVGTIITEKGREELMPKNDEDWANVRNAAAVLVESGNLLMMEGRAYDRDQWITVARGMTDAANTAIEAAETKDVEALFDAGGAVYEACTACHAKYALGLQARPEE